MKPSEITKVTETQIVLKHLFALSKMPNDFQKSFRNLAESYFKLDKNDPEKKPVFYTLIEMLFPEKAANIEDKQSWLN